MFVALTGYLLSLRQVLFINSARYRSRRPTVRTVQRDHLQQHVGGLSSDEFDHDGDLVSAGLFTEACPELTSQSLRTPSPSCLFPLSTRHNYMSPQDGTAAQT